MCGSWGEECPGAVSGFLCRDGFCLFVFVLTKVSYSRVAKGDPESCISCL